jgi:hypothetical protein
VFPAIASAQYEHLAAGFVGISLSPSQEATLYGLGTDTSPDPAAYVAEWEKMPAADVETLWGGVAAQHEDVVESLWGEDDDVERKKQADVILCTVHGIICKKGICKEYARLLREKERADREAEKAEKAPKGRNSGGGGELSLCVRGCRLIIFLRRRRTWQEQRRARERRNQ